ncbi:SRPBCC domain-containing protein [Epilithonimonas sp. UC225_85]|uniref:SRPBCC family protein n=1 Tax=Epilithonimonas sp. UC225_85 TaxID=3350167 RepID=UPI0036D32AA6
MNSEIIFNADIDSTSIYVMKVFPADVTTVWEYFTKSELIDKWWGPKPWNCETIKLDFRENGIWHYAMVGPNGEKAFCVVKYGEINEHRSFDQESKFSDEKGITDPEMPETKWLFGFTGVEEGTKLTVNIKVSTKEKMEQQLQMGFEGGFKMGLNQLEDLLSGN